MKVAFICSLFVCLFLLYWLVCFRSPGKMACLYVCFVVCLFVCMVCCSFACLCEIHASVGEMTIVLIALCIFSSHLIMMRSAGLDESKCNE